MDNALADFYNDAVSAAKGTANTKEHTIREWCEEKLITSAGTRSTVYQDVNNTAGMSNKVVKVLQDKYLIHAEERARGKWYELTHDRLIKPIKDSNTKWRNDQRKKKLRRLKIIAIPCLVALGVVCAIALSPHNHPVPNSVIGDYPFAISINPKANMIYVANRGVGDNTVSVIDGKTNQVIKNIKVGIEPTAISVNPSTNTTYVTNSADNTVSVIDSKTNRITTIIRVGSSPNGISVNPSKNIVYVANYDDNSVSVIDSKTNTVMTNIKVGAYPYDVSVDPLTNLAYVPNVGNKTVSVIDGNISHVITTIKVGRHPSFVSVNPSTNMVYVVDRDSDLTNIGIVTVIDGNKNTLIPFK